MSSAQSESEPPDRQSPSDGSPAGPTALRGERLGHGTLVCFLLAVATLYVGTCFAPVVFDETEGQYAGAAREMLRRGDWLVPTNDGIPRLQKPPLVYWSQMLSYRIFGVTVFGARLPNAVATIAWILATYLVGTRMGGQRLGLFGAMILATMLGFFIFTHLIMPEPFLGAWLTLTFWCLLSAGADRSHARRWFIMAWVCMGFGCATKGLHGLLYPVLVAFLCALVFEEQKFFWRQLWSPVGIALFLVILVPWYLAVELRFPGFLHDHFINEQVGHLLDKRFPPDSAAVPSLIFWMQHFIFFMPWTLFIPAAVWAWHHKRIRRQEPRRACSENGMGAARRGEVSRERTGGDSEHALKAEKVLWLWIAVTAVSIIFSARQDYYTMTCWGALAILLALPWAQEVEVPRPYVVIPCLILTAAGALGLSLYGLIDRLMADATFAVEPFAARDNLLNAINGFSFGGYQRLVPMMKLAGVALFLGGGGASWLAWRRRYAGAVSLTALTTACLLVLATWGMALMGEYYSLEGVARGIRRKARLDSLVVCEGQPHLATSLFFYLEEPIYWVGAHVSGEFAPRVLGIGAHLYLTEADLEKAWKSPRQTFLITERANIPYWQQRLGMDAAQRVPVGTSGTRLALANRE